MVKILNTISGTYASWMFKLIKKSRKSIRTHSVR